MSDLAPTATPAVDPALAGDPAPAAVSDPAPAPASIPADPAPAAEPAPADPAAPAGDPADGGEDGKTFDASYVKGLRTENANWRTKHRDAEAQRDELQQKYDGLLASLGKLGGFVADDPATDTPPADPTEAIAAAQQREADMAAQLRDFQLKDAVRTAADGKADTGALLDSTSFLDTVRDLDPNADDYAAQVAAAVESAVTANPTRFAAAPVVPAASTGDTSTGSGEPSRLTDEQFAALSPADRLKAFEDGRYKP